MFAKLLLREAEASWRRTTSLMQFNIKKSPRERARWICRWGAERQKELSGITSGVIPTSELPADNVKAEGIIQKLLNFIVLDDRLLSVWSAWLNTCSRSIVYHPTYQRLHYLNYTTELAELYYRYLDFRCPMSLISLTVLWLRYTWPLQCGASGKKVQEFTQQEPEYFICADQMKQPFVF